MLNHPLSPSINTQTFSASVPDQWLDKSLTVWSAPSTANQPIAPNVVVAREPMPGQPIASFINDQMKELLISNSTLEIEHRAAIQWHGFEATELHISWEHDGNYLRQRQLYIQKSNEELMIISFTSRDTDFTDYLPLFNDIEQSFNFK